jgi:hypothetical protein
VIYQFIVNTFANMPKPVFAVSIWGIVCRLRGQNNLIHFRIRL